jgi:hypothetical protein
LKKINSAGRWTLWEQKYRCSQTLWRKNKNVWKNK